MEKSKYIKVTDSKGRSSVVLVANKSFYKSQGYKIEEPTEGEIEEYFPAVKTVTGNIEHVDASALAESLEKANQELSDEKAEHDKTKEELVKVRTELDSASRKIKELEKANQTK